LKGVKTKDAREVGERGLSWFETWEGSEVEEGAANLGKKDSRQSKDSRQGKKEKNDIMDCCKKTLWRGEL